MFFISFHVEEIEFHLPHEETLIISWLTNLAKEYDQDIDQLTYVFCSDDYLLAINKEFLQHDYYTDIITFPIESDTKGAFSADIYISIDRVRENAETFCTPFTHELYRVMAHGLLHMIGFGDKTATEAKAMRQLEDKSLKSAPHVSRET